MEETGLNKLLGYEMLTHKHISLFASVCTGFLLLIYCFIDYMPEIACTAESEISLRTTRQMVNLFSRTDKYNAE